MLHAAGIYMAPVAQAFRKGGPQSVDIMAAVRRHQSERRVQLAQQPEEESMQLDFSKLDVKTLAALARDKAVPPEMVQLAQAALKQRQPAEPGDDADAEAIAASHRSGGFSGWVDRQNAKHR